MHAVWMAGPVLVIVLCGKRKSGKDYVAARLQEMCVIIFERVCKLLHTE